MTVQLRFVLDEAEMVRQFRQGGLVWVWMTRTTGQIRTKAVLYAPVDTGYMRNNLTTATQSSGALQVTGLVGTSAKYAVWVHEGTRPHVIRPKTAKVLAFKSGGSLVFASHVNHPGTKARPFLRRAMTEVLGTAL